MAWLRWEANMKDDPRVVRAGPWGGLAWRALLEMTKALDWRGVAPRDQVDGMILARHLGFAGSEKADGSTVAARLGEGLEACERVGLLVPVGENGDLGIPGWPDMQPDPTSARRVAKHRRNRKLLQDAKKGRGGVTVTNRGNGDGTGLDGTGPTAKAEAKAPRAQDDARAGPEKKRRDLSTPVERLLREKGIALSSRGGCGISAWRKHLRAATAAGAPDQEVADAIEAASPMDKPWDALQPITNRYGKASRRDARGFRLPSGAPRPAPSFGEGKRVDADEEPREDL